MKVLLCEDIRKLGWYGDVVEVNDGYARNYLLPKGLATIPSDSKLKTMTKEKAQRAAERRVAMEKMQKVIAAVEGAEVVIAAKANEQGILFGSVSETAIAENLRSQGFEISDDMVELDEHIKTTGTHRAAIKAAPELTAAVKVVVVAEGENVESAAKNSEE